MSEFPRQRSSQNWKIHPYSHITQLSFVHSVATEERLPQSPQGGDLSILFHTQRDKKRAVIVSVAGRYQQRIIPTVVCMYNICSLIAVEVFFILCCRPVCVLWVRH